MISESLAVALEHHQAGRLPEAEGIYRQILEVEPNYPDAWHLLGVVAHQAGQHERAAEHIHYAIRLKDTDAAYYNNLGEVYRARQMIPEAIDCYQRAIELSPNVADSYNNLGLALREQGQRATAITCYLQALQRKPDFVEAYGNLGLALQEEGQLAESIACYRRAAELKPDFALAQNNLGALLALQGEYAEAIVYFKQSLQTMPDYPDAHHNIGAALLDMGQAAEAVPWIEKALQLQPDYPEAHNSLGNARQRFGQMAEAAICYQKALQLKPDYPEAHNNLGLSLQNQGHVSEAIHGYERALYLRPDFVDAHVNRSFAWLLTRNFEHGWLEYEWRWLLKNVRRRSFCQPQWDGQAAPEKTVLLHAEQGLGDTIQFIRYVPLVKQLVGRVIVECQERLVPLLANCSGVDQWITTGQNLPDFDLHAPLLSLPRLFRTSLADIPADVPYVAASPELIEQWRVRLSGIEGIKVGISWQGNPTYRFDHCRSIPLAQYGPLAELPGIRLISLQKSDGTEQLDEIRERFHVEDISRDLDEQAGPFMDTAAVMMNLDLVITSDSAIAHLAGALGVPVWVALPMMPDWRWLLDRDDSPWYPTMRLFRQKTLGEWEDVFESIASELRTITGGDRSRLHPATRLETPPIAVPMAPGELLDKIAILEIKTRRISDGNKSRNVQRELALLRDVRDHSIRSSAELVALAERLATVNERLWEIEDHIRECEANKKFGPPFVELARSVYIANDERSAVKLQINELLGSTILEEKAYKLYDREAC